MSGLAPPLIVDARPMAMPAELCGRTMPSSIVRTDRPGLRLATTLASVVMPRICATATPRPASDLLSWYSSDSIDSGRDAGSRDIAAITNR